MNAINVYSASLLCIPYAVMLTLGLLVEDHFQPVTILTGIALGTFAAGVLSMITRRLKKETIEMHEARVVSGIGSCMLGIMTGVVAFSLITK
jgi:uncharacterized membrane protein